MITALPTLYKRTVTGDIQTWWIGIQGDSYHTVSGKIDGKKVKSAPVRCEAKNVRRANSTTPVEQALAEAQAKWIKKKNEGYTENTAEVDDVVKDVIKPALAKDYNDYKHKITYPIYSQPKLDGLRCIITREGAWSRNWKRFVTVGHIQELLKPVFEKYPNIVAFDGEVYNHEYKDDFNSIVSIVKQSKVTDEDLARSSEKIQYHVYDYIDREAKTKFADRTHRLAGYIQNLKTNNNKIVDVETTITVSQDGLDELMGRYIEAGYEGQMIRFSDSPYEHKRTNKLLKRKEFVDEEFEIIGFGEGKGNREGCVILRCITKDGKEFDSSVKGSVDYTRKLYSMGDDLIGLFATIKYQRLTPDGIPKFLTCIKFRNAAGEEVIFE
jgi:DNA ligase-1